MTPAPTVAAELADALRTVVCDLERMEIGPSAALDRYRTLLARYDASKPAPEGDVTDVDLLWHKVECWFGQACAAKEPFQQGYFMGKARNEFFALSLAIRALSKQCGTP